MAILPTVCAWRKRLQRRPPSVAPLPQPTEEQSQAGLSSSSGQIDPEASAPSTSDLIIRADQARSSASRISPKVEGISDAWETTQSVMKSLRSTLTWLQIFSEILDGIGEAHPYVQVVTGVIDKAVIKPALKQDARDQEFEALLNEMKRTYELVKQEFSSDKPASYQTKLLLDISRETEACARFIEAEYVPALRGFWTRTASNTFRGSSLDQHIQEFKGTFSRLREDWSHEKLRELDVSSILDKLVRVQGAGHTSEKACLPNTRVDILNQLETWIDDPAGSRIRFLIGVAGSGKSSIAHTVAATLHRSGRLASFFAFDRSEASRQPVRLLGTIAHGMALWNEGYRAALVRVLRKEPLLRESADINEQWTKLIVEPARAIVTPSPVLIVIDAFDECSSSPGDTHRQTLLHQLTSNISLLPHNLRVLVTSRGEPDVMDATSPNDRLSLDDVPADEDILVYVRHRFLRAGMSELSDWQCATLADAADGLFQWAATACSLLEGKTAGTNMAQRLNKYLPLLKKGVITDDAVRRPPLNQLYIQVLEATFDTDLAMESFRSVMSLMLCATTPLSIDALEAIYSSARGSSEGTVGSVLGSLGVVLSGTNTRQSPVRPMHTSFRDFLLDPDSGTWHVPHTLAAGHCIMAIGTLRLMAEQLTFNMCNLPSSCTRNSEVRDLPSRLALLPPGLRYSLSNWEHHTTTVFRLNGARRAALTSELGPGWFDLKNHLPANWLSDRQSSGNDLRAIRSAWRIILMQRFLFWLECLSLCGNMYAIPRTLKYLELLFHLSPEDTEVALFVADAQQFFKCFYGIISSSAPQIYLSALPQTPKNSPIRCVLLPRFARLPVISPSHLPDRWPSESMNSVPQLASHEATMAYSSDRRFIRVDAADVSQCWDATTTVLVGIPSDLSWRYPNTRSEDGGLKVNIERGNIYVRSSSTGTTRLYGTTHITALDVSPDGSHFVTGYADGTVRLWDSATMNQIGDAFEGLERVVCVVLSPDRKEIAALFPRSTVRVWPIDPRLGDDHRYPYANFTPQPELDPATGREYGSPAFRSTTPLVHFPEYCRYQVWTTGMRALLGAEPISVDFSGTCHGTEWAECHRG